MKNLFKFLVWLVPLYALSALPAFSESGRMNGEYTYIHIVALNLNIWSSEKVVSIDELKLSSPIFLHAKTEGGFEVHFEKGYSIKLEKNRLFYNGSLVKFDTDERNIYFTQNEYQLGVFIRLFDK